jgi:hypothetical protein
MAANVTAKSVEDEVRKVQAAIAERDQQIAFLSQQIAEAEAAQATATAPASSPAPAVPPSPAETAAERQDRELTATALIAQERPQTGSRRFWLSELEALGRLIAPGLPPASQRAAALRDPRGNAFARALQECAR